LHEKWQRSGDARRGQGEVSLCLRAMSSSIGRLSPTPVVLDAVETRTAAPGTYLLVTDNSATVARTALERLKHSIVWPGRPGPTRPRRARCPDPTARCLTIPPAAESAQGVGLPTRATGTSESVRLGLWEQADFHAFHESTRTELCTKVFSYRSSCHGWASATAAVIRVRSKDARARR
jgi:hypothetical protein